MYYHDISFLFKIEEEKEEGRKEDRMGKVGKEKRINLSTNVS